MPNYNEATHQQHGSGSESLEQVLDSLQAVLDHNRHILKPARPRQAMPLQAPEPFAGLPAEQYDDPLCLDEQSVSNEDLFDIPVLDEIIAMSGETVSKQEIDDMLTCLHGELDSIVDEIMQDTRQRLQTLDADAGKDAAKQHLENNLQRFLRELTSRNTL